MTEIKTKERMAKLVGKLLTTNFFHLSDKERREILSLSTAEAQDRSATTDFCAATKAAVNIYYKKRDERRRLHFIEDRFLHVALMDIAHADHKDGTDKYDLLWKVITHGEPTSKTPSTTMSREDYERYKRFRAKDSYFKDITDSAAELYKAKKSLAQPPEDCLERILKKFNLETPQPTKARSRRSNSPQPR